MLRSSGRSPHDQDQANGLFDETWELEVFISGALLFGLLQMPGRLDGWWESVRPHAAGDLRMAYFMAYYYLSLITYTLIGTFALHIAARAYWIGLMGLRSVFPEGPDWSKSTSAGPIATKVSRDSVPPLSTLARKADDFCSLIFSFAFLVIGFLLVSVLLVGVFGGIAYLIKRFILPDQNGFFVGMALFYLLLAPLLVATVIDRTKRERLDPKSGLGRFVERTFRWSTIMTLGPLVTPILMTFSTRVRRTILIPLALTSAAIIFGVFTAGALSSDDGTPALDSHAFYPEARTDRSVDYRFYADRRPPGRIYRREPVIQSDMITDPYVRLFIPYNPRDDNELLGELCPEGPLRGTEDEMSVEQLDEWLGCIARRYDVSLDGERVDAGYAFHEDPSTTVRGVITYIPVAGLEPGRHELRLTRQFTAEQRRSARERLAEEGDPGDLDGAVEAERRRYVIPFWT